MTNFFFHRYAESARQAILACEVTEHTPLGWRLSMDALFSIWDVYGQGYFDHALFSLRRDGLIHWTSGNRVYLTRRSSPAR